MSLSSVKCYFPTEIIHAILLSLPIKSLLRCSTACKSWNSLIKSPTFIDAFDSRAILSTTQNEVVNLFLVQGLQALSEEEYKMFYSLHWDNPSFSEYTKLPISSALVDGNNDPIRNFDVVGVCNGLVCLANSFFFPTNSSTIIWNPNIRKLVVLPRPSVTNPERAPQSYVFGYDSRTNDYKVILLTLRSPWDIQIWSLARGNWKSLGTADVGEPPDLQYALVNGVVHWVRRNIMRNEDNCILTLDIASVLFGKIMMPESWNSWFSYDHLFVSRYKDSVAFYACSYGGMYHSVQMWVMNEYGVKESWAMLVDVQVPLEIYHPVQFWYWKRSDKLVLIRRDRELLSVDLNNNEVEAFGIDGYDTCNFIDYVAESLELLGHPNAISYQ